jgi:hypothetical protein
MDLFLFFLEIVLITVSIVLMTAVKASDPNAKTYQNVGIAGLVLGSLGAVVQILFAIFRR